METTQNEKVRNIARTSIIASLMIITTVLNPIGWGMIQFRVSEALVVLPFFNRKNMWGVVIGMAVANAFSPMGLIDVAVGVSELVILYAITRLITNNYLKAIVHGILSGLIVGWMLLSVLGIPFIYSFISITISTTIVAMASVWFIEKNQSLLERKNVI